MAELFVFREIRTKAVKRSAVVGVLATLGIHVYDYISRVGLGIGYDRYVGCAEVPHQS